MNTNEEMRQSEQEFTEAKAIKASTREQLKQDLKLLDERVRIMNQRLDDLSGGDREEIRRRRWPWWDR